MSDYDSSVDESYIIYLDVNSLYSWAMLQYLPVSTFKWLHPESVQNFDVTKVPDDSDTGYILEVDLEYPDSIHDLHSDLPFCPEKMTPPSDSKKQKSYLLACTTNKIMSFIIEI